MSGFIGCHASLYHGATWRDVARALDPLRAIADLITTTETFPVHGPGLIAKGWLSVRLGECAVLWRTSAFQQLGDVYPVVLTEKTFRTGRGGLRDGVTATGVLLGHRSGNELDVEAAHLPASVQMLNRWRPLSRRAAASRDALDRWGAHNATAKHVEPRVALWRAYDGNLDQHRDVWMHRVEDELDVRSVFQTDRPERGTHKGGRLIDGINTWRLAIEGVRVRDLPRPFDHDALIVGARFAREQVVR